MKRCTRRNFCAGLVGLLAAPYVIRDSGVLMPVRQRQLGLIYYAITPIDTLEVPLGSIYPFVERPPKEWLPFDGRIIWKEQYPELFRAANWGIFDHMKLEMYETVPTLEVPCNTGNVRCAV